MMEKLTYYLENGSNALFVALMGIAAIILSPFILLGWLLSKFGIDLTDSL